MSTLFTSTFIIPCSIFDIPADSHRLVSLYFVRGVNETFVFSRDSKVLRRGALLSEDSESRLNGPFDTARGITQYVWA